MCYDMPPGPREVYIPAAGDMVFFAEDSLFWRVVYALARTGPPYHVAIIVRLPNGDMATLEAAPYTTVHVFLLDALPRMRGHHGVVWVRRLREPLTAEQSACLTNFALAQTGKRYALGRMLLEATPLRNHGRLHARLFGRPWVDRHAWFCSELTAAAAAHAGLIDPHKIFPNTVYPRDLFMDCPHDFRPWWEEPRRWTGVEEQSAVSR
jgi:hypothetical protein